MRYDQANHLERRFSTCFSFYFTLYRHQATLVRFFRCCGELYGATQLSKQYIYIYKVFFCFPLRPFAWKVKLKIHTCTVEKQKYTGHHPKQWDFLLSSHTTIIQLLKQYSAVADLLDLPPFLLLLSLTYTAHLIEFNVLTSAPSPLREHAVVQQEHGKRLPPSYSCNTSCALL